MSRTILETDGRTMLNDLLYRIHLALRLSLRGFTDDAINNVLQARKHAARRHQCEVTPEHLLLAMATDPRGFAPMALGRLGLDLPGQTEAIAALIDDAAAQPASDRPCLGPATEQLVIRASHYARRSGLPYVGTEHLLMALLSRPGRAAEYRAGAGLTVERCSDLLRASATETHR